MKFRSSQESLRIEGSKTSSRPMMFISSARNSILYDVLLQDPLWEFSLGLAKVSQQLL